jgi:hypothetical protein
VVSEPTTPYLDVLRELDLLPTAVLAAFVVGSTARGWAHSTSDVDLIVVTDTPFIDDRLLEQEVTLDPGVLSIAQFGYVGRRCEVKYWLGSQVDQLFDKVAWKKFDTDRLSGDRLTTVERLFLARLGHCIPLSGQQWIDGYRNRLDESAFRPIMISQALAASDLAVQAAVGQLDAGNIEDAALLARTGFEAAMEALMFDRGEYEAGPKWRAKLFRTAAPELVTFDQYWSVQSMRTFDSNEPRKWIDMVLELCQTVSLEIVL